MTNLLWVAMFTARSVVSRRKTVLLVALAAAPAAFGAIVRRFAPPGQADPFFESLPLLYVVFLCQILPLFFAGSLVRDAVEDRTAAFLLSTPTSRTAYVFGAWLGLLPPLCVMLCASAVAAFAAWRAGVEPWWTPEGRLLLGELTGVACLGAVVYSALFTLLGLYVKWPTVVGIAYYGVVEALLGFLPGPPRRVALSSYLEALLDPPFRTRAALVAEANPGLDAPIAKSTAWIVLASALAAALLLMARGARRRDFVDEASGR
jgi:ABC-2 type transport system permease protein